MSAEKVFLSLNSYSEAMYQLARVKPSAAERLQKYADDLEVAVEQFVLRWQADGYVSQDHLMRMMQEIAYCRTLYAHVSEKPLLAN